MGDPLAVSAHFEASGGTGVGADQQTTRSLRPAPSTSLREMARAGRNRPTSRHRTPARLASGTEYDDGDQFGASVTISDDGNTVAVSAIGRKMGGSPGVNADSSDNSARTAGAVYVFSRSGETWTESAYIKPVQSRCPGLLRLFRFAEWRWPQTRGGQLR